MRFLTSTAMTAIVLASGAAIAQPQHTTMSARGNCAHVHPVPCYLSDGTPIDHGPQTPDADKAYMGGGVVLQGQPGGPAPDPGNPANLPPSH